MNRRYNYWVDEEREEEDAEAMMFGASLAIVVILIGMAIAAINCQ